MFYCFLADGFEETEALAPVDILRRAGIPVTTVGVGGDIIRGSHNIYVKADLALDSFAIDPDEIQGVILPGGMPGVKNLYAEQRVLDTVDYCAENSLYVCAICAAPSIPGRMGLLSGKRATCFPGFEGDCTGAEMTGEKVAVDGRFITSKGAGCALDFGFEIVAQVAGREASEKIATSMQLR